MKKSFLISLMVAALVCAFALPNVMAGKEVPADMVLKAPEGMKAKKTPVQFSHGKHSAEYKIDCMTCHHKAKSEADIKGCAVAGCHDQPGKKESNAFYAAYHSKKSDASCVACHKKMKKGPKSCKECHPKNK